MKITFVISRVLLGLIFLVFGLNGFLNFIHMPAPTGLAGQFMGSLYLSHYLVMILLLQIISGVLLLSGRFISLALTLLGPVLVNIFCFHVFMAPDGLPLASFAVILWVVCFWNVRAVFAGIFQSRS
jgi:putative oxidoreductase